MSLRKKIDKQIKNMPKYSIAPEVFDTQALAKVRAFGQDRDVQMAQEDIETGSAQATSQAKDVSTSTADLLSTISAIETSNNASRRGLLQDQATIRRQNVGDLYQANQVVAEEKDKAWYQNVYAPWDAKLRNLQQRKQNRAAFWGNITGGLLSASGFALGGPVGGAIAGRTASTGASTGQQVAQTDASLYGYNPLMPYS